MVLLSVTFNVIGISFFSVYDIIREAVILVFSSHINQGTKEENLCVLCGIDIAALCLTR